MPLHERDTKQNFAKLSFTLEARTSSWHKEIAPTGAKAVHRSWSFDFPKCQSVCATVHDFSQLLLGFPGMEQSPLELWQAQVPCSEIHIGTCRVHIHGDPLLQPLLFATHIQGVAGGLLLQACPWACCPFFCVSAFLWHAETQGHCATCTCQHPRSSTPADLLSLHSKNHFLSALSTHWGSLYFLPVLSSQVNGK